MGKNLPIVEPIFTDGYGQRIYSIRASKKQSQADFARGLMISNSYLSELENERKKPSGALLNLMSEAHGVSAEWIATGNPRIDVLRAYVSFKLDPANYATDPDQEFVEAYNLGILGDLLPVFVTDDDHPKITTGYLEECLLQGEGQESLMRDARTRFAGTSDKTHQADPALPGDWFSLCVELAASGLTPELVREKLRQCIK